MTAAERLAQARLLRWAASLEPGLREALAAALRTMQDGPTMAVLARALEAGDVEAVVAAIFDTPIAVSALSGMRATYQAAVVGTAAKAVKMLPGMTVRAPVVNRALLAAVEEWENEAFKNLVTGAREGLRAQVADELRRQAAPLRAAQKIKSEIGRVGLTAYDEQILINARADLAEGRFAKFLQRELRDKRSDARLKKRPALTPAQIDDEIVRMRRKLVANRSVTFARTSALDAANASEGVAWQEAVDEGAVNASEVRRYWSLNWREGLCDLCMPIPSLNPDGVGLNEDFITPNGPKRRPTMHPRCRCTVWTRVERAGVRRRPTPGSQQFQFDPA